MCCIDFNCRCSAMARFDAPMFAANVDSSVVDSSVSVSGPLAGMFGAPTIEPLIDSQVDATASAAPAPESPVAVTSDASVRHNTEHARVFCFDVCLPTSS